MKNTHKHLYKLIIFLIALASVMLLIYCATNTNNKFKYILSIDKPNKIDNYESFFETSNADFNTEGKCFYDYNVQIQNIIKEELKPVESNEYNDFGGYEFYVGYFKTIDEAIYFSETNYKKVNDYIFNHSQISSESIKGMGYEYRIEEICDSDVQGYVVLFTSLEEYIIQLTGNIEKGLTYIENIHNIIQEDKILSYFNVFYISDVYLGNKHYMHFNISN